MATILLLYLDIIVAPGTSEVTVSVPPTAGNSHLADFTRQLLVCRGRASLATAAGADLRKARDRPAC